MGKAEKVVRKIASQEHCKGDVLLNKLTGGITPHVRPILFRDDRLEAKKRRKRWVDFVKAKRAKHLIVRAVWEFVDLFYAFQLNQMISFNAGFSGRGGDFADSMAKARRIW